MLAEISRCGGVAFRRTLARDRVSAFAVGVVGAWPLRRRIGLLQLHPSRV
jgi:hypothetical protein